MFFASINAAVTATTVMKHVLGQWHSQSSKYVADFIDIQEADTFLTDLSLTCCIAVINFGSQCLLP